MEIKNLRRIDKGSLKAFFTLSTELVDYNDWSLKEGRDGNLYADTPAREYVTSKGEKKWSKIVYIKDATLRDRITDLAKQAYFGADAQSNEDIPF